MEQILVFIHDAHDARPLVSNSQLQHNSNSKVQQVWHCKFQTLIFSGPSAVPLVKKSNLKHNEIKEHR